MLKWARIATLTALLIASIIAAYLAVDYFEPKKQDAIQEAKNKSQIEAINILASERVAYYTKVLAIFTGALSAFGLLQIFFLIRADGTAATTAKAALRSARVAEDALLIGERPHMYVTEPIFCEPIDKDTFNYDGPEVWPWFALNLRNEGKTPAVLIEVCAESICARELPPVPEYRENRTYDQQRRVFAPRAAEAFSCLFKTPIDGRVMNDISIGSFHGGRELFAYGYIKYEDIFGYTHTVGYCWRYKLHLKRFLPEDHKAYNYRKAEPAI